MDRVSEPYQTKKPGESEQIAIAESFLFWHPLSMAIMNQKPRDTLPLITRLQ